MVSAELERVELERVELVSANNVITLECSPMSSHDHVTLRIWNLLDTPLIVYNLLYSIT
jgi:hypothetical protein